MAEIENGYYYIKDGVVLKEDGYTDSVDKVGKVVGFDYETEIRTKAIEEFAERLITNAESFQAEVNGFRADLMTHDYFMEFVDEIAESMKGEKE
jgi:hypothetical protein